MSRCHACGKEDCPSQADPPTGPFMLHNRAAYAALLKSREVRSGVATGASQEDLRVEEGLR